MKSNTIKLLESINSSSEYDWFNTTGLSIAKSIAMENGNLNNCDEVSEKVVNEATFNCNVITCSIFTKNDNGTSHDVIGYKDNLIDYTQEQFFGNNNPEACKLDVIKSFKDIDGNISAYTNNTFKAADGNNVNYFSIDLIEGIRNNTIIPDSDNFIIYVV